MLSEIFYHPLPGPPSLFSSTTFKHANQHIVIVASLNNYVSVLTPGLGEWNVKSISVDRLVQGLWFCRC